MQINIEINGENYKAENGTMLIELADECGIQIPRFCYHKNLSISANCRMCLVEVDNAPKPMPACATPITDGMKVFTKSTKALAAQKAVMEFLLINHPLDCPVCDQGGECDLQDFSIGYGEGTSQYSEIKRVVKDKGIGPLISTEMTRCIHCTRCVRFGQEIAGIREMGATGRGEHMEIGTYIEKSIDSELSGNIIDLCPVGALTSKPFRFNARSWEMQVTPGISAHDCVGSNLEYHSLRGDIKRVIARENQAINETWISDRDRFSYLGLNHKQRLQTPMIKIDGIWQECDWEQALETAVDGIKQAISDSDVNSIGALISPSSTTEESYLVQKIIRGIGSNNIDHRLSQSDYLTQETDPLYLSLGMPVADLVQQEAFLIICSNTRKEQPIIAHHIRQATLTMGGSSHITPVAATVSTINSIDYSTNFEVNEKIVSAPINIYSDLLGLSKVLVEKFGADKGNSNKNSIENLDDINELIKNVTISEQHTKIIDNLLATEKSVVMLGSLAQTLPDYSAIRILSSFIAKQTQSTLSHLTYGANSSGASIAGALPHRNACLETETVGLATQQMFDQQLKAYILNGIEAEYDIENPDKAINSLKSAFVVNVTSYVTDAMKDYADVLLPASTYTESSGTFVNIAGDWQSFTAVTNPKGESRPAWKIFRVLGNLFDIDEMDYISSEQVKDELYEKFSKMDSNSSAKTYIKWTTPSKFVHLKDSTQRIAEKPLYSIDAIVRRSSALQQTADAIDAKQVRINSKLADSLKLNNEKEVIIKQSESNCSSKLVIDDSIPDNYIYLASGIELSTAMGCSFSNVKLTQTN